MRADEFEMLEMRFKHALEQWIKPQL